jgi:PadR family transcriptional regulator, regulatory protein PadR
MSWRPAQTDSFSSYRSLRPFVALFAVKRIVSVTDIHRKALNRKELPQRTLRRSRGTNATVLSSRFQLSVISGHVPRVSCQSVDQYRNPIFIVTNRIRSQIVRGSAELAILALLAEDSLLGFEISRRIGKRTEGALHFALASLYPMLHAWNSAVGRDRRYYKLTSAGKKQLEPLRHESGFFFRALDQLAGVTHT